MNGSRSTFMRKGYLLTALAAAVLLAASSGTAWAQTTVTADEDYGEGGIRVDLQDKIAEGDSADVTVSIRGAVPAGADEILVTVTLEVVPTRFGSTHKLGSAFGVEVADDVDFHPRSRYDRVRISSERQCDSQNVHSSGLDRTGYQLRRGRRKGSGDIEGKRSNRYLR